MPSQSLSCDELQSLASGATTPSQVPYLPSTQVVVPGLHIPKELPAHSLSAPSVQSHPVLGVPSQSSSLPGSAQSSPTLGNTEHSPQPPSAKHVWVPSAQLPNIPAKAHDRTVPSTQPQPPLAMPSQSASSPGVHSSCSAGFTSQAPNLPSAPHRWVPRPQLPLAPPSEQDRDSAGVQASVAGVVPAPVGALWVPSVVVSFEPVGVEAAWEGSSVDGETFGPCPTSGCLSLTTSEVVPLAVDIGAWASGTLQLAKSSHVYLEQEAKCPGKTKSKIESRRSTADLETRDPRLV